MSRVVGNLAPEDVAGRVGAAIRSRRVLLGLSQSKLGEAVGIRPQQVHKYEAGRNQLSLDNAMQIASALGWSLPEMLAASIGEQAATPGRPTLELAKRFSRLTAPERHAVASLVACLAGAA